MFNSKILQNMSNAWNMLATEFNCRNSTVGCSELMLNKFLMMDKSFTLTNSNSRRSSSLSHHDGKACARLLPAIKQMTISTHSHSLTSTSATIINRFNRKNEKFYSSPFCSLGSYLNWNFWATVFLAMKMN